MIAAEAPVLFAKACELFILDLTLRAWYYTDCNKRKTLQRNDIAIAVARDEIFEFLTDIVPTEDARPIKKVKILVSRNDRRITKHPFSILNL